MRILDAICNRPWLVFPDTLKTIVDVVTGEHRDEKLAEIIRAERDERPAALTMRQGQRLDNARSVAVRDGVAHVPIVGPIVRRADFFTRVSGLTSIEAMAADFQAAVQAPEVRAILLELDSPGGEVTAVPAFAEAIRAARQQKPVWAYVDGMAASAGYWLASAADTVVTDPAGLLGSIGAVLAVRDPSKSTSSSIEFVSSQSPYKRANPLTDEGRAQYQRVVDQTAEAFVEAVAGYRGVSVETVLAQYGQGGLLVGRHAVEAGLADRVGTFETTLAELAASVSPAPAPLWRGYSLTSKEARMSDHTMTAEELQSRLAAAEARAAEASAQAKAAEERAAAAAKQVEAAEERARKVAAEKFATDLISAGKALPAQRGALVTAHEAISRAEGGAAALEAVFAEAPTHKLLGERVAADGALTAVPLARTATDPEAKELEGVKERAAAYAAKANGKAKK